ncbi:MAG: phosphoribosylamine--glycine ligase [Anaeromicrobium sp.]|jgi:phosphoribosylamine--glycine ligase|uniref:phosphoribosylamine--glycine ligase n=1 Tax=Anaeromicrobium sp. TaxID=1929132 RepID=UPI0025DB75A1|nr:phosphoribosylamine--glycine ligase [Anaeromicrobium sp.]MCT4595422.1 phosphoribosylamine--glycine ligase [Anaeromicrobium sp.]
MKVLVVGSGAREHVIGWKLSESPQVDKIYFAPGNGGTETIGVNIHISETEIDKLKDFAKTNNIDLTVVGPEVPLVMGIVDQFENDNLRIFGPNRECSKLEGSKAFTKKFLIENNIPTAKYVRVDNSEDAIKNLEEFTYPVVIKADGLAAGKGVIIAKDFNEAKDAIDTIMVQKKFGQSGNEVVMEEFLEGIECSLLCFVDGDHIVPMESAKDYKAIYDNDLGPNTGGMGTYSPNVLYDHEYKYVVEEEILKKMVGGFNKYKLNYKGILFIGLMMTKSGPKVLEINTRFGDPETQVILTRLESDLYEIMNEIIDGNLKDMDIKWKEESSVCVVLASGGYPNDYEKNKEIKIEENHLKIFHGGTKSMGDKIVTNGGRVLSLVALGKNMEEARNKVYESIPKVNFENMYYRKDIGKI